MRKNNVEAREKKSKERAGTTENKEREKAGREESVCWGSKRENGEGGRA